MDKLFLTASDGVKIAANIYDVESPAGWCVLLHMRPATKESWQDFAQELQRKSYESLAIDLRGHGESDFGPDGYLSFSDEEHQKSILDLEAAVDYLIQKNGAHSVSSGQATPDKIILIGASIGANLALQYIKEHSDFEKAVLFSPGLNYRGIGTEPLVKNLKANQKVFFISAKDDRAVRGNAAMVQRLFDLAPEGVNKKIEIYETPKQNKFATGQAGGHGTDILKNHPELKDKIIEFLK